MNLFNKITNTIARNFSNLVFGIAVVIAAMSLIALFTTGLIVFAICYFVCKLW